jgi:hypothetical protein
MGYSGRNPNGRTGGSIFYPPIPLPPDWTTLPKRPSQIDPLEIPPYPPLSIPPVDNIPVFPRGPLPVFPPPKPKEPCPDPLNDYWNELMPPKLEFYPDDWLDNLLKKYVDWYRDPEYYAQKEFWKWIISQGQKYGGQYDPNVYPPNPNAGMWGIEIKIPGVPGKLSVKPGIVPKDSSFGIDVNFDWSH